MGFDDRCGLVRGWLVVVGLVVKVVEEVHYVVEFVEVNREAIAVV